MANRFLTTVTITTIGLTCKAFLNFGYACITVNGLSNLVNALNSPSRDQGKGIVTVSNHISTLDDPTIWGVLPTSQYLNSRMMRWTLGASDVMFTNPVFAAFFRKGHVLETFRGAGIDQPAVSTAIEYLNQGEWIHLFGEGKVNQPDTYIRQKGHAVLPRFKWGTGQIVMEADIPPVVIPMWITGFEKLMPEGRKFPWKFLPRYGVDLSVTFGIPISADTLKEVCAPKLLGKGAETVEELLRRRTAVTSLLHQEVQSLGRSVSGGLLGSSDTV